MIEIKKFLVKWLSLTILRSSNRITLAKFRDLERISIKLEKARSHLSFNETCINNELLPTYTSVVICRYSAYIVLQYTAHRAQCCTL